jgi:hypothetical protein
VVSKAGKGAEGPKVEVHIQTLKDITGRLFLDAADLENALRKTGWWEAADLVYSMTAEALQK